MEYTCKLEFGSFSAMSTECLPWAISSIATISVSDLLEEIMLWNDTIEVPSRCFHNVLRWTLFARSGKEGSQLPPTVGTLIPHANGAFYNALICRKSTVSSPILPPPTAFSWIEKDGQLAPVFCTLPPAPEALMILRKCGCEKGCKTGACGCKRSELQCTDMCECGGGCKNRKERATEEVDKLSSSY